MINDRSGARRHGRRRMVWAAVAALATAVGCGAPPPPAEALPPVAAVAGGGAGRIVRLDPVFDTLVADDAVIQRLADGYGFTEGPHWIEYHGLYGGAVLFSDIPGNTIVLWSSDGTVSTFLTPVFEGEPDDGGGQGGSNGITTDPSGRVVFTEHGHRRISRIEPDGSRVIVVDRYEGRRLNSPNDLVYRPDGALYFTDPPYGLPRQDDDPAKELEANGIYRLGPDGDLTRLASQTRPNGLAFSPDGSRLYVANSDPARRLWMVYDVVADGGLANGRVFADVTADPAPGLPDGLKVDARGHVWATGPGGIRVFDPDGRHLGSIELDAQPANLAFGGGDGATLFITAESGFYRVRVLVAGAG